MKILEFFIIGYCLAAGLKSSSCDVNGLNLPEHADKWNCTQIEDWPLVPTGTVCFLKCDPGYIQTQCEF